MRYYKGVREGWGRNLVGMTMLMALGIAMFSFTGLFVSAKHHFDWTGFRPEVKAKIKLIHDYEGLVSQVTGVAGKTSVRWQHQEWIKRNLTRAEAHLLLEHPVGALKALAAEHLLSRVETDVYKLLKMSLNDTTSVIYYQSGCVGWPMLLGEYLMVEVTFLAEQAPPPPPGRGLTYNELSEGEIRELRRLYKVRIDSKEDYLRALWK